MNKEEKSLLLKDLSARLPYDVMVDYESNIRILNEIDPACKDIDYITVRIQDVERLMCAESVMIENIKPYLRPMSSMTEEEEKEICQSMKDYNLLPGPDRAGVFCGEIVDWLNSHHFDYRGLIEKNLAIAVTKENNPYET